MRNKLILLPLCWMISFIHAYADVHFSENGFEYSSLPSWQAKEYPAKDTADIVMVTGYDSFIMDGVKSLLVPSSVMHEGKRYMVKEIGNGALGGLTNVESIVIEEGIEVIRNYAFCYCHRLKSVSFPTTFRKIGYTPFIGSPNMRKIVVAPGNKHYDSRDNSNAIIDSDGTLLYGCNGTRIPSSVEEIERGAFEGCETIEEIIVPDGVTDIGARAFSGCHSLKRVSLPESLTSIAECAFENCSSLESIYIPRNVEEISGPLFLGCNRLSSIVVDKENAYYHSKNNGIVSKSDSTLVTACKFTNVTADIAEIENDCFESLNIHSFRLPKSVTDLPLQVFLSCNEIDTLTVDPDNPAYMSPEGSNVILTKDGKTLVVGCRSSVIPDGIEEIEEGAFDGRYQDVLLRLPEGVRKIGKMAFYSCDKIRSVILPSTLREIGWGAFSGCRNLLSVDIPEGITDIDRNAFSSCEFLQAIHLPSSVNYIGMDAFRSCSKLTEMNIPEGVTKISDGLFCNCTELKRVHLPSSIEKIEFDAFKGCKNLTEINIPEGVKKIGSRAFSGCVNLKQVNLPSTIEEVADDAFEGCPCEENVKCKR